MAAKMSLRKSIDSQTSVDDEIFSRSKDRTLPMKSRNTREAISLENIDQSLLVGYKDFPNVPTSVTLLKESQGIKHSS